MLVLSSKKLQVTNMMHIVLEIVLGMTDWLIYA